MFRLIDKFSPRTVARWKLKACIPVTRVAFMHMEQFVVRTTAVIVVDIAYLSITTCVLVEGSAVLFNFFNKYFVSI